MDGRGSGCVCVCVVESLKLKARCENCVNYHYSFIRASLIINHLPEHSFHPTRLDPLSPFLIPQT